MRSLHEVLGDVHSGAREEGGEPTRTGGHDLPTSWSRSKREGEARGGGGPLPRRRSHVEAALGMEADVGLQGSGGGPSRGLGPRHRRAGSTGAAPLSVLRAAAVRKAY